MAKLIAGLDDIATETHKSEGWCYFCLPETEYRNFEVEAKNLISDTKRLTFFHGTKFKADQTNEYEQFLRLIRKYAETSAPTILCCTLNSENWKRTFLNYCDRITTNVFTQVGVTNASLIDVCKQLTPGLFSFMRFVDHFGNAHKISIDIDSDNVKEKYRHLNTVINGHQLTADFLMTSLYNNYRKIQFPNSPQLSENGISVLRDSQSLAVQAADVIGNYSNSYLFYKLGNTSKKRVLKGEIFERVFGDKFSAVNFATSVQLVGQNDIQILTEGAYTMEFSAY